MHSYVQKAQKLIDVAMQVQRYTYPMQENAERPLAQEFASVRVVNERNPSFDQQDLIENADGTFTTKYTGVRILVFEVLFTRGIEAASEFISSFYRQDVLNIMREEDLSVLQHVPITNDTLTLETNWEIRHGLYLECLTRTYYEQTTETINAVSTDYCVNDGTHIICGNINIK